MAEIFSIVVSAVGQYLIPSIGCQINYLCKYTENFKNLRDKIVEMEGKRESVQHKVDEAKNQGEDIEKNVENWLARVNKVIAEAEELEKKEDAANDRCFMGLCPNLMTRRQLSEEAVKQLGAIDELLKGAGRLDRISYRSVPEDIRLLSSKDYEAFQSRVSTLNDILSALKDPDVNMLGIYGMGGIGKTTLAKEVARQVKTEFDRVIFVEVSQSPSIREIQGEIADKLGLKFNEESESGRADRLFNRLKQEKRILIILDNIWEKFNLVAIGIPHKDDHEGCKVLLTARNEDVLLRKMVSQKNFSVEVLKEEEAWSLFKKMAGGDYIEGSEFKLAAIDVAEKCAGLPVSIVTVATALRNKRLFEWKDALEQLRRPSSMNFKNIQSTAYSAIELSYNHLESEELKKIFLLIGYAALGSVDDLLMYGMGLGLFQDSNMLVKARARVQSLVQKLKASCMLLNHIGKDEDEKLFSMHDVVRDVAIAIASREENVLTVTNGELVNQWESLDESTTKLCTAMILHDVKYNDLHEVLELECPQLKLISIFSKDFLLPTIPDNFFTGMIQVRVLVLINMNQRSLPSSLGLLVNLRTLCLKAHMLQDVSVICDLRKLEILYLQCLNIMQLPEEVGQLTRLKLLNLSACWKLKVILPNVLSKLSHLEELYMPWFGEWGMKVEGLKNASLDELNGLSNLTSLEITISDVNTLPRDLFLERLEKYDIRIGNRYRSGQYDVSRSSRKFSLELNNNISLKDGLIVKLEKVEDLSLYELQDQDIKNFVHELANVDVLQLKNLTVAGCDVPPLRESKGREESTINMRLNKISSFFNKVTCPYLETLYLHSMNIERIWQNQFAAMSCCGKNLTSLTVNGCKNLRCVFSSAIVDSFIQLKDLEIHNCPVLEEIIVMDQERKNIIFPRLLFLEMTNLEKLASFCRRDVHTEFPSLKKLIIKECHEFVMQFKNFNHDLKKEVPVFPDRTEFTIEGKQLSISTFNFLQSIPVKILQIRGIIENSVPERVNICLGDETNGNGMMAIISVKDMKHILKHSAVLDNLERLHIQSIKTLVNLVPSSPTFQNLTILVIWSCDGLIKLFTSSTAKSLVRLRVMKIKNCSRIKEIVADDEGDNSAKCEIVFRELNELELLNLRSLTSFCSNNDALKFPSLETLLVERCNNLKIFSEGELSTPKLHKVLKGPGWIWEDKLNTTIQLLYYYVNGIDATSESMENPRTVDDVTDKSKPCQLAEIVDSGKCRLVTIPESTDSSSKVVRLLYTNSGVGLLALGSNGVQKLWKWLRNEQNPSGRATASAVPQHWQPRSGLLMANDVSDVKIEEAVPCIALSEDDYSAMSATGGKVLIFSMITFKVTTTFMSPPPAATFLAFHPGNNCIIAVGMEDSTIHIYDVFVEELISELKGHQNRITGLAFSKVLNILVSSDADGQLFVWSLNMWHKIKSVAIQIPTGKPPAGDTRVQFSTCPFDVLVVHETQLAIYNAYNMESMRQWIPQDALFAPISCAVYSCNSQLVFATFCDGNIGVFDADTLVLRYNIAPSTYLSPSILNRSQTVYPLVVAAHPSKPNQFAIGLTDGSVKVMEPLKSEWSVEDTE